MGDSQLSTPETASYELALANRKLVTVVMGMTLLMGLVACLAYLAGRSVTGIRAEQASPAVLPPPVIVERAAAPPSQAPAPVAVEPSAPMAAPVALPAPAPIGPRLYLQVAAGEVADFQPLRSQLEKAGLPLEVVLLEDKHRLLVGPVRDQAQKQEFETRLTAAGHPFFARRL
jgi:cell division septation protein DedD